MHLSVKCCCSTLDSPIALHWQSLWWWLCHPALADMVGMGVGVDHCTLAYLSRYIFCHALDLRNGKIGSPNSRDDTLMVALVRTETQRQQRSRVARRIQLQRLARYWGLVIQTERSHLPVMLHARMHVNVGVGRNIKTLECNTCCPQIWRFRQLCRNQRRVGILANTEPCL